MRRPRQVRARVTFLSERAFVEATTHRSGTAGAHDDIFAIARPDGCRAHGKDPLTMLYQPSVPVTTRHSTTEHAPRPRPTTVSLDGIGDIVDAGRSSGYAHLSPRRLPTLGQVVSAAKIAAVALRRPALWPTRRGHWQSAPRPARHQVRGRFRVTTVSLEPNSFIAGPEPRMDHAHTLEALHLVSGRAHLITSGADGQMLSAAELTPDRVRVVGDGAKGRRHLVNTGDEVAVLVRVTA